QGWKRSSDLLQRTCLVCSASAGCLERSTSGRRSRYPSRTGFVDGQTPSHEGGDCDQCLLYCERMAPGRTALTTAVAGIEQACARATTADELFEVLDHEIGKALPFDASMWFSVDPATLLATAPARIEGVDGGYCD